MNTLSLTGGIVISLIGIAVSSAALPEKQVESSRSALIEHRSGGASLADFDVCYASSGTGAFTGSLYTIDKETGLGTMIGQTGMDGIPGLAIDSSGVIYGMDRGNAELYIIDASTAEATFVGATGLIFFEALAFSRDNVLYGVDDKWNFYKINHLTAEPTFIGYTGDQITGLAFDPTDGTLYGSVGGFGSHEPDAIQSGRR